MASYHSLPSPLPLTRSSNNSHIPNTHKFANSVTVEEQCLLKKTYHLYYTVDEDSLHDLKNEEKDRLIMALAKKLVGAEIQVKDQLYLLFELQTQLETMASKISFTVPPPFPSEWFLPRERADFGDGEASGPGPGSRNSLP